MNSSKNLACGAFCLISLACGAFYGLIFFNALIKKLVCGTFSSQFFYLNQDAFDSKFLVLSTNSLVVEMIPTPILSDHNDMICTKQ